MSHARPESLRRATQRRQLRRPSTCRGRRRRGSSATSTCATTWCARSSRRRGARWVPARGAATSSTSTSRPTPSGDQLGEISPFLALGRTVNFTDVHVDKDGSDGGPAVIVATGDDAIDDFLNIYGLGGFTVAALSEALRPTLPLGLTGDGHLHARAGRRVHPRRLRASTTRTAARQEGAVRHAHRLGRRDRAVPPRRRLRRVHDEPAAHRRGADGGVPGAAGAGHHLRARPRREGSDGARGAAADRRRRRRGLRAAQLLRRARRRPGRRWPSAATRR